MCLSSNLSRHVFIQVSFRMFRVHLTLVRHRNYSLQSKSKSDHTLAVLKKGLKMKSEISEISMAPPATRN